MKGLTICLLLSVVLQGNTAAECNSYNETAIQCKFTKDISFTKTDFAIYFISHNGKRELLIECGWLDDELECIEQEGFECKQPVTDVAEISVPSRFKTRPGSYICLPEGYNTEDSKPCQFVTNQHKDQTELVENSVDKSHPDQKEKSNSATTIIAVSGAVLGFVVIAIVTVMLVKRLKPRSSSKHKSDQSCQYSKADITEMESRLTDESDSMCSVDIGEVKPPLTSGQ